MISLYKHMYWDSPDWHVWHGFWMLKRQVEKAKNSMESWMIRRQAQVAITYNISNHVLYDVISKHLQHMIALMAYIIDGGCIFSWSIVNSTLLDESIKRHFINFMHGCAVLVIIVPWLDSNGMSRDYYYMTKPIYMLSLSTFVVFGQKGTIIIRQKYRLMIFLVFRT